MLKNELIEAQLSALKSKNAPELEILRYILSQIKNKEIEKKDELTNEEALTVLRKISKELKESIESFTRGGRQDLIAGSKNQLEIVSRYLPQEISDDELKKEVQAIIDNNQELYKNSSKAIIGLCMKELKDKADPQRIMAILKSYGAS